MPDLSANLIATLASAAERHDQVAGEINDPAVAADPARLIGLTKELARLRRVVEPYRRYIALLRQRDEARAIGDDPAAEDELKQLAAAEASDLAAQADAVLAEVQDQLVLSEDAGIDSALLEIRAGTGGDEAALFAADLLKMYSRYAERRGWAVEVLSASGTDLGGFREVVVNVRGDGAYRRLAHEAGAHRVQRVPKTEAQGRIHTSAATVAVLPEPEDVAVNIDWDADVVEHVSRAGGPGGQNVNKVASAIRLEHLPTGITVSMRDEKSQHKNRAKARRILATRVADQLRAAQAADQAASRKGMIGSGDRSQRIRTYNFPQSRCTDHRLKAAGGEGANFNLQTILDGQLDALVEALLAQEKARRLAEL